MWASSSTRCRMNCANASRSITRRWRGSTTHLARIMAISLRINTRNASRNIITDAFEYAKKYGYKSVTIVEKPNVIRETSGLMIRTAREVAKKLPRHSALGDQYRRHVYVAVEESAGPMVLS